MRIGKWVPLFKRMLPIPRRLSMAFGLYEGSELHLARITDSDTTSTHRCELIVSPIPTQAWPSACRLSVRLSDHPHALATATSFLRRERINILLSECCVTYQQRAHWDAICDMGLASGFNALDGMDRLNFAAGMEGLLGIFTKKFETFADDIVHRGAFLQKAERYTQFSPLTGLNDASFICGKERAVTVEHRSGAVELPERLAKEISSHCRMQGSELPAYALITGNTEQRYMRVFFLKDYDQMFRAVIDDDMFGFAGGGVGLLNQLLTALPKQINLLHTSNYIFAKRDNVARGRIVLTGHWNLNEAIGAEAGSEAKRAYMESQLGQIVDSLQVVDIEGVKHPQALTLVDFAIPQTIYPRVFISYSTGRDEEKLKFLMNALLEHQFQPVLGTDTALQANVGNHPVAPGVMQGAFGVMSGCVAFISLQLKRDDFKRVDPLTNAATYVMPPWAVAEEVFAWSSNIGFLVRLKDAAVEDLPYNREMPAKKFKTDAEYPKAVGEVLDVLNEFRQSSRFAQVKAEARRAMFRNFYLPADH
jgi:hypothetical protein